MIEDTNYPRLWRSLVICAVLCIVLFWIPAAIVAIYYYLEKAA